MFEKKSVIYNENMGVCRVEDITNLTLKKGDPITYYVLRSLYENDKVAYIPVQEHNVVLRELITREEALEKKKRWQQEENGEETAKKEQDTISWRIQYEMMDTLPKEECLLLFEKSEVDYVLSRTEE